MDQSTLRRFFDLKYINNKIALLQAHINHEVDFGFLDGLRTNPEYLELRNDARNVYLFCIIIRPSVDKNKTTHTSEIFSQMFENVVQIAQHCDDFIKEIAYYDSNCTVLRIKNQLDYVKELKLIDEGQKLKYNEAIDELFLKRNNFHTYRDLDTILYNILACLCEIKGLISSNKSQVFDFIEYDQSQSSGY